MSAVDMEVRWSRQDLGDILVHHYMDKVDKNNDQDRSYRGRTALFKEKLQYGNTSLLLKNVKVSDGGQYTCRVDSAHWSGQVSVLLKIEAVGRTPEITVLGTDSGGVLLQCDSKGWWPVPELQWLDSEGAEVPAGLTESCEDGEGFYVRRSLTAHSSDTNTYTCRVKQGQNVMHEKIDITDHLPRSDYTAAIVVAVVVILLSALVGVVVYYRRRAKQERVKRDIETEEDMKEFVLSKYDRSEEGFLKLQKVVKSCRKAQLSNCNLTEKSCEVLASVLTSNSHLTELDLIDNELCDSRVKKLCTGLQSPNCKLQKLRLSTCSIREEGCAALASALKKNPSSHLRELELSDNKPGDSGVKKLSDLLEDPHCKLEKLELSDCSIREEGCAALASALKKNPSSHLRELNLSYNHLPDSGVKKLSDLLEDSHCTLEKLQLYKCSITEEGCDALASALKKNPSSHLRELNLNYNKPEDSGVKKLSDLLEDPHCKLEKLELSDCSITEEGCAALASALKKNPSSHLRELNLSYNKPGPSGVKKLSDLLEDPHCKLEKLELSDCSITEEGCAALASALKKNPSHLRELYLSDNKPGDSGVKKLSDLLEDPHCTLKKLWLSTCSITEEGCAALASALKKNPSSHLRELNLSYNKPGPSGVKKLSDLLEDPHCKLETLALSTCSIREEGCAALASALKKNPSSHLRELNLSYSKPGPSGVKKLSDLLEDPHCTLEKLELSGCSIREEGFATVKKKVSSHLRRLKLKRSKPVQ
ncbi:hypothetical protein P4O66_020752 [Electrophorus voltai]|uniref:Ig-like domain-containing protein n=1 Tax=Electrophorus voltai TaxID=2609070 RepID=A0AAD8ZQJ5_9TELE|nr:hypothetical protein P4O66_020752 [Electrophorus voltai]